MPNANPAAPTFIYPAIPNDEAVLAKVGVIALQHTYLDRMLRMTIKTLAGVTVKEALDATAFDGAATLRDRVRRFARRTLGEGTALVKLQAILERCRRATERRNELIHSLWAQELDGEALIWGADHVGRPQPSPTELTELATELSTLAHELNEARLHGFIATALAERKGLEQTD